MKQNEAKNETIASSSTHREVDLDCDAKTSTALPSQRNQFGIASLFWLTFSVGLAMAYLRRLDSSDILTGALAAMLIAFAVSSLVGWATTRMGDSLFWGTLICAFGYISVASEPVFTLEHRLIWAILGASTGAIAAACFAQNRIVNGVVCALVAGCIMLIYWLYAGGNNVDRNFDVVVAPLVGLCISIFVWLVTKVEQTRAIPRYVAATALLTIVILANLMGR